MSIPPSNPRQQSIQEILDEGRRNDEAARNAPKPHPAQQLLDYHDQIARENQVYDYDPELLAALASQNKQQAKPVDAIKYGQVNGLYEHMPDDAVPPANYRQQPVQTAQLWGGQNDYFSEEKEAERQLKAKQAARAKKMTESQETVWHPNPATNGFNSRDEAAAYGKHLVEGLYANKPVEYGGHIYQLTRNGETKFYLTPIVTNNMPGHVNIPFDMIPVGGLEVGTFHIQNSKEPSPHDMTVRDRNRPRMEYIFGAGGTTYIWDEGLPDKPAKAYDLPHWTPPSSAPQQQDKPTEQDQ